MTIADVASFVLTYANRVEHFKNLIRVPEIQRNATKYAECAVELAQARETLKTWENKLARMKRRAGL